MMVDSGISAPVLRRLGDARGGDDPRADRPLLPHNAQHHGGEFNRSESDETPRFVIKRLHSSKEVPDGLGEIIVQTAPDVYRFIYGSNAVEALSVLVRADANCFSWEHLWVAFEVDERTGEPGQAVGVLVGYEPKSLDMSGYFSVLSEHFGVMYAICCAVRYNVLYALAGHDAQLPCEASAEKSFLLQEIAVSERARCHGIATRLINALEIHAQQCCSKYCLSLEVEEDNTTASRLYEHLGFQYVGAGPRYYTCPCLLGAVRWSRMVKDCANSPFPDPDYMD